MITGDPIRDAEMHDLEEEEFFNKWVKKCPWCNVCDEPITDYRCYVMDKHDKMGSCIHKSCMDDQIEKIRKAKINTYLIECIVEMLEYKYEIETPHGD